MYKIYVWIYSDLQVRICRKQGTYHYSILAHFYSASLILPSCISHNTYQIKFQNVPQHLIIFSTNDMECHMLMGTCTHRRSIHAESTKYIVIQRPMLSLSDFCRIWVCSPIPNHQLPSNSISQATYTTLPTSGW